MQSVYMPDERIPMFPEQISTGRCSVVVCSVVVCSGIPVDISMFPEHISTGRCINVGVVVCNVS